MTMIDDDVRPKGSVDSVGSALWLEVETGFWVGSGDGRFFGSVERRGDTYLAQDGTSTLIGGFDSLAEAKTAIVATLREEQSEKTHAADRHSPRKRAPLR